MKQVYLPKSVFSSSKTTNLGRYLLIFTLANDELKKINAYQSPLNWKDRIVLSDRQANFSDENSTKNVKFNPYQD